MIHRALHHISSISSDMSIPNHYSMFRIRHPHKPLIGLNGRGVLMAALDRLYSSLKGSEPNYPNMKCLLHDMVNGWSGHGPQFETPDLFLGTLAMISLFLSRCYFAF